ncbi:lipid IV(A) 3-deoxy-D-manno-octulosonic acid transferase [Photobacterium damselae]|uniref:lipid IV(A) 3-deoxy-D-manno-octulosonic acid transferase n=1 Tax=Photobacterium damselae TaxID=38293 RepID=UPI00220F0FD5|nr:lipid IV(A) 3-deoxy-D-manno-octulosonic acid transferase [Photobacterium damselae]ELI6447578.1 lipid IV(A) 3-deoxy-D-manno-octulosonic acid transferase [Photobacterium damselae]WIH19559.1 lipid IV(A) 3-deoxy-D-manno-octulosonic acid transferase [Photobacterium damselae]BDR33089.1 3-deoxy-D-manno-octulosonic acid transferase [Photobacterium damselae subsp. damselae]
MLIRILYSVLLCIASPFLLFGLYKNKPNKPTFGSRWKEHFGITPKLKATERPIWIHAVSVGESIAAIPLIKALKEKNPKQPILVTTTTSTGAEQIAKLGDLVEHRYMPIDFGFAVKSFLKKTQPQQMLIIETELWPNTLHQVSKYGVPITVVNARLSEKSYNNYAKVQPLFNLMLPCLTQVLCQTESDANRFEQLGVNKDKLLVTGSIKFDIQISDNIREKSKTLRQELGQDRPVWIAASTHKGEDEQVLEAHKKILEFHSDALLILVPRHPDRFDDVFKLCQQQGFETIRRTTKDNITDSTQIYLGDTMGEMLLLIGSADVCFMGGSLIGDKVGGHNVLEPAALGVPVITGPSYFNFKNIINKMLNTNSIVICNSSDDLAIRIDFLFSEHYVRDKYKQKLSQFIKEHQGSIEKTIRVYN